MTLFPGCEVLEKTWEGFKGEALKNFSGEFKSGPVTFLQVAIQLSENLRGIHQNNLIHKHINPDNIQFDPDGKGRKLPADERQYQAVQFA